MLRTQFVCVFVCVRQRELEKEGTEGTQKYKTNEKKVQENLSTCRGWVRMRNEVKKNSTEVCTF